MHYEPSEEDQCSVEWFVTRPGYHHAHDFGAP